MNHDDSPRPPPAHNGGTGVITANTQWHDAELALKVARHSFDRWLVAGHDDTWSLALMHAYHTHEALHEAARAITLLIETVRAETAALVTTPAAERECGPLRPRLADPGAEVSDLPTTGDLAESGS
jgi:hypothetical protein